MQLDQDQGWVYLFLKLQLDTQLLKHFHIDNMDNYNSFYLP